MHFYQRTPAVVNERETTKNQTSANMTRASRAPINIPYISCDLKNNFNVQIVV